VDHTLNEWFVSLSFYIFSIVTFHKRRTIVSNLQKMGSFASIGLGLLFIGYIVLLLVIMPAQGVGPGTLNDPINGISFLATSGLPMLIDFIYMGIAVAILLITLSLYERLRAVAPVVMQISAAAGVIATVLFLGYAMINFVGSPVAVSVYEHDTATGGALYLTLRVIANGLNAAALFASGWAILLAGWSALGSRQLPMYLSYLMIGAGAAMVASFVLLPVGLLAVVLAPVWSIWLGVSYFAKANRTVLATA
jgi:hypothetical protein